MALVAGPHRAASAGAKTVAVLAALILPTLLLLLLARSGGGLAAIRGNAHVAITLAVQRQQQQPAEAPRSSSPADQQQQQQQQQPTHSGGAGDVGSTPTDLPLLCGGPGGVPSLAESLAASAAALEAAADEDFAQYEQQGGFSLEDVEATAEQLGADRGDTRFVHLWFEASLGGWAAVGMRRLAALHCPAAVGQMPSTGRCPAAQHAAPKH